MSDALRKVYLGALHLVHLLRRPMTLGVRVAAFDAEGRVFLVRHTYVRGWYLPGGGVDPGETVAAAARRELSEEGDIECLAPLRLVSAHHNIRASRRDHVILFRCDRVRQRAAKRPDREIAESGFFAPDALPAGATEATRRRLAELLQGEPAGEVW